MKVLLDGRLLSNKITGIHRYSVELIKSYQAEYGIDNVQVLVMPELIEKPTNAIVCDYSPFNFLHFFRFHSFLQTLDFDIYHSLYYSNSFKKLKNKKYITTVHDLMYTVVPHFFSSNPIVNTLAVWYYDIIVKRSLQNSDYIISVSTTTQTDLSALGFSSKVFYEGVNQLGDHANSVSIEMQLPQSFFFYCGNIRKHKNIRWMMDVFLKSNTDKTLLICTKDDISVLGDFPKDRIVTMNYVSDAALKELYAKSSAFVYPSKYEGFGLPVLEALQNNCKVICSDGGALKEFDKGTVLSFSLNDETQLKSYFENIDTYTFNKALIEEMFKLYNWESQLSLMHADMQKIFNLMKN
jgi:glycosyltransferase involved in cell wall biosynthesis